MIIADSRLISSFCGTKTGQAFARLARYAVLPAEMRSDPCRLGPLTLPAG